MIRLKDILNESYVAGISDIDIVATTIVGEACGEGYKGMQAVKNVLQNRAKKKGRTVARISLMPSAFSMWNKATAGVSVPDDFNKNGRPEIIQSIIDFWKNREPTCWDTAVTLAKSDVKDITGGATHYWASGGAQALKDKDGNPDPPYWAEDWKDPIVIGNHTFGISS
jgi:N-acetylmuramoyl-L-alanine amidase